VSTEEKRQARENRVPSPGSALREQRRKTDSTQIQIEGKSKFRLAKELKRIFFIKTQRDYTKSMEVTTLAPTFVWN
jgi:hypothetical protein